MISQCQKTNDFEKMLIDNRLMSICRKVLISAFVQSGRPEKSGKVTTKIFGKKFVWAPWCIGITSDLHAKGPRFESWMERFLLD